MKRSDEQLSELQESIGVAFADAALLEQALVHDSFVSEFPGVFSESNERFEFLGDAVLDLIVAQELVARFPDSPEGHLTQMRASLVNKASLAEIGGGLDLGSWLLVGRGEAEMGGFRRESNLASAFEALVAALFLDQGYDAARDFVVRVMDVRVGLGGRPRTPAAPSQVPAARGGDEARILAPGLRGGRPSWTRSWPHVHRTSSGGQ